MLVKKVTKRAEVDLSELSLPNVVWFRTKELSQVRGKPGKGVTRLYPGLSGGETQRLVEYMKGGYVLTIATPTEWEEAYASAVSCMTKLKTDVYQLWVSSKVHLFILRDSKGIIVARCLGKRLKRAPCYGEKSYILASVLRHLAGVDNEFGDWLSKEERESIKLETMKPYIDGHDSYRPKIYEKDLQLSFS